MTRRRAPSERDINRALHDPRLRAAATVNKRYRWTDGAACRTRPDLFFPGSTDPTDEARAVCRTCPVKAQCLRDALDNGQTKDGIRCGTEPREREAMAVVWARLRAGQVTLPPPKPAPAPVSGPAKCGNGEHPRNDLTLGVRSDGREFCRPCVSAAAKKSSAGRHRIPVIQCGTLAGAEAHWRRGERRCASCRAAVALVRQAIA